jgi:hypothetical protein
MKTKLSYYIIVFGIYIKIPLTQKQIIKILSK